MDKQTTLDKINLNIEALDNQLEVLANAKKVLGEAKAKVFDCIIMVSQAKDELLKFKEELESEG